MIGLFAQPVTRVQAALAKLAVFGVWGLAVSLALTGAVALLGFGLGYGALDDTTGAALGRLLALCVLSLGLAAPVAWIATLARSVLAAVGGTIALVVAAQVGVLAGAGGWMPFAAPGLWAISSGAAVTPLQLGLSVAVPCLSVPLVCVSWRGMQLDR